MANKDGNIDKLIKDLANMYGEDSNQVSLAKAGYVIAENEHKIASLEDLIRQIKKLIISRAVYKADDLIDQIAKILRNVELTKPFKCDGDCNNCDYEH